MEKKKYEIILSVITILTVIVTAIGVTFAYFTAGFTGEAGSVTVNTATIGGVTFDGGADFATSEDIEPGWKGTKAFTITVAPSNVSQVVYVKMRYINGFTDMTAKVEDVSNGAKGAISLVTDETNETTVTLVEKTFEASDTTQTITYTLTMEFPNKDEAQNYDQGKVFEATLFAELSDTNLYYNHENPTGTTTKPTV